MSSRRQLGRRGHARDELDGRLDLLAHLVVGYPEDRGVGDAGVRHEDALDLGGVDVDPAADDHVDLAVTQEQVALGVHVADVTDGADPGARCAAFVLSSDLLYRKSPPARLRK